MLTDNCRKTGYRQNYNVPSMMEMASQSSKLFRPRWVWGCLGTSYGFQFCSVGDQPAKILAVRPPPLKPRPKYMLCIFVCATLVVLDLSALRAVFCFIFSRLPRKEVTEYVG